jgi:membrane-bound serine protease (ClpP class)
MKTGKFKIAASSSAILLAFLACQLLQPHPVKAAGPQVVVIQLDDTIQPISDEYFTRALNRAASMRADAVLVELNTPGGLLDSTRDMVHRILESPVPVIFFVAPSGSRAGSAGFFLLEAADIAAMAPGTNAGAAHPVAVGGGQIDATMKQKLENDTAAFLRSYVTQRKRNATAAEDGVLNSKSYTEKEAQQLNLIDVIAADDRALLDAVDGRTITRFNGVTMTLHTRGAQLIPIAPTLRERLLDHLMDPNLAVLILVIGGLLIYLEFNTPGTIVPGSLGTLLVLLALFALNLLPVHYTAVMLLIAAFTLILLEAKFASHGVLAAVGIFCLVFGTLTLVDGPIPELRVHMATAIGTGIGFGIITVILIRIAVRAYRSKSLMGPDALVGEVAVAQQSLTPSGQVLVHGELWRAEAATPVEPGEPVRVRAVRQLTLLVERVPGALPRAN